MLRIQLASPFFQKRLQLWVHVRSQSHGWPFPVGLASLVVTGAMPDHPPALLVFEQCLPDLQLAQCTLPAKC